MKFSHTLLPALIATSLSTFVHAHQFEVSTRYSDYYDSTLKETELQGTYYFSQVITDTKPLAEAAFLGRNSGIYLAYSDFDSRAYDAQTSTSVSIFWFIPNSIFFAGIGYTEDDDENDAIFNLGITPIDGLLIATQHSKEADDYNANIYTKYVILLDSDRTLNIEASVTKNEWVDRNDYVLLGDFYFNRNFSFGAAFSDGDVGNTYGLSAQHFFIDTVSVEAKYYHLDTNKDYDELYYNLGSRNVWSLALSVRF